MNIEKLLETVTLWITAYSMKILAAIIIVLVGKWLAGKISRLVARLLQKNKVDITLVNFFQTLIYYTLMVMIVIAGAGQLGINMTSFLTIVGAAGLAIGLALKDSLSNFAAGIMLIIFRPFKVGDFVTTAGVSGSVVSITLFNTILNTPDNQRVIVPNSSITASVITNVTANETRRVDLVIGISYDDNIKKAKDILTRIVQEDKRILEDPKPNIAVLALGDSSVNIVVRPWVKTSEYWDVYFHLTEKIKTTFDAEGITIPYPQTDVHLHQETAA